MFRQHPWARQLPVTLTSSTYDRFVDFCIRQGRSPSDVVAELIEDFMWKESIPSELKAKTPTL